MVNRPGGCGDAMPPGTVSVSGTGSRYEERRKQKGGLWKRRANLHTAQQQNDANESLALMDE